MANGKGFSKLMDTSMSENMQTIKKTTASGSNIDSVSKKHSQIDKIFSLDPKVDSKY